MEPVEFDTMNETDVREVIVRPLLGRLGYRHGTAATIRTEISLKYNNAFLGRKKANDPPLAGRADYVLDAVPFGRWVVEVKAPSEKLTRDCIEQAHTYAAHPEIAASYFLVTNGREYQLFETSRLEAAALSWSYEETDEKILALFNLVSPQALRKRAGLVVPDRGKPLGAGLASRMEMIGGDIVYEDHRGSHPLFATAGVDGLSLPVTGGTVERDEEGKIKARVRVASAMPIARELQEALRGDDSYDFFSVSEFVSTDPENPTLFSNFIESTVPAGTPVNIPGMGKVPLPFQLYFNALTEAVGFAYQDTFQGTMRLTYNYRFSGMDPMVARGLTAQFGSFPSEAYMEGAGRFSIRLRDAIT